MQDGANAREEMWNGKGSGRAVLELRVRAGPMALRTVWIRVLGREYDPGGGGVLHGDGGRGSGGRSGGEGKRGGE